MTDPPPPAPPDLCLLVPVWRDYAWLIPVMIASLERYWPGHPPLFLVGLTSAEAGQWPCFPRANPAAPRNWCSMVLDGVRQARAAGFRRAYLLTEDAAPLAPCHVGHLHRTLPDAMTAWDAAYIGLMGWDNRRHAGRDPVLGPNRHGVMHLVSAHAPRFHLHPALWRLDVIEGGCELTLRTPGRNGSSWHFEKTCDKLDADLPPEWKRACYQIAASRLSTHPPSAAARLRGRAERWLYHRLMAIVPHLPQPGPAGRFAEWVGFDDVYCDGPYPMFFAGVLRKGRLNRFLVRRLRKTPDGRAFLARLEAAAREGGLALEA